MSGQSEQILENQLIAQLQKLGYQYQQAGNEKELLTNLRRHNSVVLAAAEL